MILFLRQTISRQIKGSCLPLITVYYKGMFAFHCKTSIWQNQIGIVVQNNPFPEIRSFNIASRVAKTYRGNLFFEFIRSTSKDSWIPEMRSSKDPPRRSLEISADFGLVTSGNGPGNITFARKRRTKRDS